MHFLDDSFSILQSSWKLFFPTDVARERAKRTSPRRLYESAPLTPGARSRLPKRTLTRYLYPTTISTATHILASSLSSLSLASGPLLSCLWPVGPCSNILGWSELGWTWLREGCLRASGCLCAVSALLAPSESLHWSIHVCSEGRGC